MTSARNHQQLLSGSKWFVLFLVILAGCANTKKTGTQAPRPTDPGTVIVDDRREPSDTVPYVVPDSLIDVSLYSYKDTYHIALILPMHLDSFQTVLEVDSLIEDELPMPSKEGDELYPPAMLALDYYHGVKLAVDSLQRMGLNAVIHVFDSYTPKGLQNLTNSGQLLNMDLILGPIFNSHLKIVAPFAEKHKIPMVSLLSPAGDITKNNPYFIMANPRLETHCEAMFDVTLERFADENVILLYEPNYIEAGFAKILRNKSQQQEQKYISSIMMSVLDTTTGEMVFDTAARMPLHEVMLQVDERTKLFDLETTNIELYLEKERNNVFLLPTVDISSVLTLSKEFARLSEEYEITVVGTPVWAKSEDLRLDYISNFNVYFTSPEYLDSTYYKSAFRDSCLSQFGFELKPTSIKAYDLTLYMGGLMKNYGLNFIDIMQIDSTSAWHTGYKFRPTFSEKGRQDQVEFIENKYVHLLHYDQYQVVKEN